MSIYEFELVRTRLKLVMVISNCFSLHFQIISGVYHRIVIRFKAVLQRADAQRNKDEFKSSAYWISAFEWQFRFESQLWGVKSSKLISRLVVRIMLASKSCSDCSSQAKKLENVTKPTMWTILNATIFKFCTNVPHNVTKSRLIGTIVIAKMKINDR